LADPVLFPALAPMVRSGVTGWGRCGGEVARSLSFFALCAGFGGKLCLLGLTGFPYCAPCCRVAAGCAGSVGGLAAAAVRDPTAVARIAAVRAHLACARRRAGTVTNVRIGKRISAP
jgi:hypothetical protein